MREHRYTTVWHLEAPLAEVCNAIERSLEWPHWWPGAEKVEEFAPGDSDGIGCVRRYTWKGRLPYRLTFDVRVTRMQALTMVEGVASGGLEGLGRWSFRSDGVTTFARYDWYIRTLPAWMSLLSPLASRVFRWNHDTVMQRGGEGLARQLNARLLGIEHR